MNSLSNSSYDSGIESSRSSGEITKAALDELKIFLKDEKKAEEKGLKPMIRAIAARVKGAVTNQSGGNLILEKGEAKEPQKRAEERKWAPIKPRGEGDSPRIEGDSPKIKMGRRAQGEKALESPKLDNARLVAQDNPDESLIFQIDNEESEVELFAPEVGDFKLGEDLADRETENPTPVFIEGRPKVESRRDLESSSLSQPSKPGSLKEAAQKVQTGIKSLFSRKQVKEKEAAPISEGNAVAKTQTEQITEEKRQALRSRTEAVFKQNSNSILDQLPGEILSLKSDERSKALEKHVRERIEDGGLRNCLINLGFTKKESQEINAMQNKTTQSRREEISIKEFMIREICYSMMSIIQATSH